MSKVKLKDVVARIKDKVDKDNPDLTYYIGGEHFESGKIKVTQRGIIEGSTIGPAFHMRFMPGDVLLMSRNPHLRKAGRVDFCGLCSDVSYVCRTKDDNLLLQEFLPFIFQSEPFWNFAEANKKGSTNFFLNWSDFEKFEFDLPSIDEQEKLVQMLWAIEDTKDAYTNLEKASAKLVQAEFDRLFDNDKYPRVRAEEICDFITKGTTPPKNEILLEPTEDSIPYLKVYNLSFNGELLFDDQPQYIPKETHEGKLARSKVYPDDVLMNIVGPPLGKFSLVTNEFSEWNINQAIVIFRAKPQVRPKYLLYSLMQPSVMKPFIDKAVGVRQLNISLEQCRNLEIVLPPLDIQDEFIGFIEQNENATAALKNAYRDITSLQRKILNKRILIK